MFSPYGPIAQMTATPSLSLRLSCWSLLAFLTMVSLYPRQKRLLHRRDPVLHDRMIQPQNEEEGMAQQMMKTKRILVGLKTLENAVELTTLASRLGSRGASLILVHVIELPDNTALDAEVPDLEAAAQKILRAGESVARSRHMKEWELVLLDHLGMSARVA